MSNHRDSYRVQLMKQQARRSSLTEEASRLMDHCRIPKSFSDVPKWMDPLAAWSLEQKLHAKGYPPEYKEFYAVIKAGFGGKLIEVEMWILAHEYD